MNDATHQAIWARSLERCIALLQEKRAVLLRNHPGSFPADAVPEYPADPMADALCRLTPEFIEKSADHVLDYLQVTLDATRDMNAKDAQAYMLSSLRGQLHNHMFDGMERPTFDLVLGSMIELEDLYHRAAEREAPKSGALQTKKFFAPVDHYCELAEGTMISLEAMLDYHQQANGVPEDERELSLFRLAQQQLVKEGALSADEEGEMTDAEVDRCTQRASDLYEQMLEPYAAALPMVYCPELPWFVESFTKDRLSRQGGDAGRSRYAANDNDDAGLHDAVEQGLTKLFIRHLETADDVYAVLAAKIDLQQQMKPEKTAGRSF